MEYCHCGSIQSFLRSGNRLKEEELREVVSCCLLGLSYLHNRNVMHRDIKPDNLFISENGVIKLGDFGLAVQLEHSCSKRNTTCGTSLYMAPEVYEEEACLKSDVWALGISIIEMAENKNPFAGMTSAKIVNQVLNKPSPTLSSSQCSSDLIDFVKQCLVKDVKKRASVEELLKHPFVKDSIDRIRNKGNSSLLLQLAEKVGNAVDSKNPEGFRLDAPSVNMIGMSVVNKPMVKPKRVALVVNTDEDFFKVNGNVTAIEMKSGLCNDSQIQRWNVKVFSKLTELVVGDNCLQFVKELKLVGFGLLESVSFGSKCFTKTLNGCFEVSGCGALRSLKMGEGCCVKWSSFVMKNCDSLQEVSIGDGCFVNCENTVFESESSVIR